MSRSFKKTPVYKDGSSPNYEKRFANKKVRRCADYHNGKSAFYKRIYQSWHICDYRFYLARNQYLEKCWNNERYDENWWKKFYFRK